jgi:hypothetical protein
MTSYCRHYPRKRVIQYSRDDDAQSIGRSVLDAPHARGMTTWVILIVIGTVLNPI